MNSIKKYFRTKLSIILAIIVCSVATVSASGVGKVSNCYYLNLRSNAGIDNQVLKELKKGETVTILEEKNGWLKVSYKGEEGWVSKKYILVENQNNTSKNTTEKASSNIETINKKIYITASVLNVRTGNSTSYKIVNKLKRGEEVNAISYDNGWYKIKKSTGLVGWVSKNYTSLNPVKVTKSSVKTSTDNNINNGSQKGLVDYAMTFIGTPYVWGGYSRGGVDCSGFAGLVYKTYANVQLNRTASDMSSQGSTVSKSNIRPGDLMFFDSGYGSKINHVGIYVGNGKMVHASSSKRRVVTTSINTRYWKQALVKIKRVALP
jgi:cell wall-associated NlpC family hydrolase